MNLNKAFLYFVISLFTFHFPLFTNFSYSQKNSLTHQLTNSPNYYDRDLIQFSGVIVTQDSLKAVPFANIIIKNTQRGTMTDFYGFFSFVAQKKDTIEISSVGYRRAIFIIPDTLTIQRYSLIQALSSDTVMLTETVIYPWPTMEQFKHAFVTVQIPDDDYDRAMKNLELEAMKERYEHYGMDASMNYRNYIENKANQLYYAGQFPTNNLLNPIAWAKFIQAWREGKFKNQNNSNSNNNNNGE
jgi:hypothetical protein